jgi:hypothetical protein
LSKGSQKPVKNSTKNNAVENNVKKSDSTGDMQIAQAPKLACEREALSEIAIRCAKTAQRSLGFPFWRWLRVFVSKVECQARMIRLAKRFEECAKRSNSVWFEMLEEAKTRKGFFARDEALVERVWRDAAEAEADYAEMESQLAELRKNYPRQVSRMFVAIERMRRIHCNNIPKLFPKANPKMREIARRHYDEGTLMDLETFINGLQGH